MAWASSTCTASPSRSPPALASSLLICSLKYLPERSAIPKSELDLEPQIWLSLLNGRFRAQLMLHNKSEPNLKQIWMVSYQLSIKSVLVDCSIARILSMFAVT